MNEKIPILDKQLFAEDCHGSIDRAEAESNIMLSDPETYCKYLVGYAIFPDDLANHNRIMLEIDGELCWFSVTQNTLNAIFNYTSAKTR